MIPQNPVEDLLKEVEEMAYNLMKPADIAILIGIDSSDFDSFCFILKEQCQHPYSRAYWRGVTQAKYDLHKSVVMLATKGSPAAQPLADSYLREQNL